MSFYYKQVPDETYCITGYTGKEKHVDIPTNIEISILGDEIFKGHTELESINIPNSVKQIGGFVFDGCTGLKSIRLPDNLKDMWQYAMTRTSLEKIEVPGSVTTIVPFTFNESKSLRTVILKEGTKCISGWAFKDCISLRNIYLPKSLLDIHEKAFEGCGDITFHRV